MSFSGSAVLTLAAAGLDDSLSSSSMYRGWSNNLKLVKESKFDSAASAAAAVVVADDVASKWLNRLLHRVLLNPYMLIMRLNLPEVLC